MIALLIYARTACECFFSINKLYYLIHFFSIGIKKLFKMCRYNSVKNKILKIVPFIKTPSIK